MKLYLSLNFFLLMNYAYSAEKYSFQIKSKSCDNAQIQNSLNSALNCMERFSSLEPYAEKLKTLSSNSTPIEFSCEDQPNSTQESVIYINNNYFYTKGLDTNTNLNHVVYHEILHFLKIPMAMFHRPKEYDIVKTCLCINGESPSSCVKKFHDFSTKIKDPIYTCVNACIPHESGAQGDGKACENFPKEIPTSPHTCQTLKEQILPKEVCVSDDWKHFSCD